MACCGALQCGNSKTSMARFAKCAMVQGTSICSFDMQEFPEQIAKSVTLLQLIEGIAQHAAAFDLSASSDAVQSWMNKHMDEDAIHSRRYCWTV